MAGWVVGKSDFNENPVVSLDLDFDLDFDLGFAKIVCLKWIGKDKTRTVNPLSPRGLMVA